MSGSPWFGAVECVSGARHLSVVETNKTGDTDKLSRMVEGAKVRILRSGTSGWKYLILMHC
jgi:hypothetical protein